MRQVLVLVTLISALCLSAAASTIGLNDWCVNVNGNITNACNGAGSGGSGTDLSGFDTTLEPGTNNLGTITVTLGPGSGQSALVYMDYDLDFASLGSFDDLGTVIGSAPSGISYELADPNTSTIFSDFAAGTPMPNTNAVGTACNSPAACDVSWALGVSGINVASGNELVTFTIGSKAPTSGFYLQQTNATNLDSIYLSETTCVVGSTCGAPIVPEPREDAFLLALLSIIFIAVRKKSQQVS